LNNQRPKKSLVPKRKTSIASFLVAAYKQVSIGKGSKEGYFVWLIVFQE